MKGVKLASTKNRIVTIIYIFVFIIIMVFPVQIYAGTAITDIAGIAGVADITNVADAADVADVADVAGVIDATGVTFDVICSKALVNLKILKGNEKGELNLQNEITRREMIVLVNRMMAYEYYDNESNNNPIEIPFIDISQKDWAYNDIKIALKYSLIKGYTDNTLRPDNRISFTEASALILRALGYENTINKKWPEGILEKGKEIGLDKNLDIPGDKILTRGEASILIYNALSVKFVE